MIKSGGPSVKSPPVKGPPGGGRMIRQPAPSSVKGPPVRKTIQPESESIISETTESIAELVPASDRRLLTPVSENQTASIKPVKTLQPTSGKPASIRPVRVMKPASSEEE
jgi:hypothetical protein